MAVPPVATVYQLMDVVVDGMVAESVTELPRQTVTGDADTPVGGVQGCAPDLVINDSKPMSNRQSDIGLFLISAITFERKT